MTKEEVYAQVAKILTDYLRLEEGEVKPESHVVMGPGATPWRSWSSDSSSWRRSASGISSRTTRTWSSATWWSGLWRKRKGGTECRGKAHDGVHESLSVGPGAHGASPREDCGYGSRRCRRRS